MKNVLILFSYANSRECEMECALQRRDERRVSQNIPFLLCLHSKIIIIKLYIIIKITI